MPEESELYIEGDHALLEMLYQDISSSIGEEVQMETVMDRSSGAYNEPVIIALILALGGPAVTAAIRDIIIRRYEHIEKMREQPQIGTSSNAQVPLTLKVREGYHERVIELVDLQ